MKEDNKIPLTCKVYNDAVVSRYHNRRMVIISQEEGCNMIHIQRSLTKGESHESIVSDDVECTKSGTIGKRTLSLALSDEALEVLMITIDKHLTNKNH